jgi:hypothetical protein
MGLLALTLVFTGRAASVEQAMAQLLEAQGWKFSQRIERILTD